MSEQSREFSGCDDGKTSPPLTPPAIGRGTVGRAFCKSARPSRRTSATAYVAEPPDEDDPLLGFAPYVHVAPRRNSLTPDRQRAFIAALAATGIVTQAAKTIGASMEALYKLRNKRGAEGFAAAWEAAIDRGIARLEDCAVALAIEGEEIPIVRGGEVVATWRKHNFGFIRFMLMQRLPRRYAMRDADFGALRPGHPVYDRLRREWAAQEYGDEQAVLDGIDAMIDEMREREAANAVILAGDELAAERDAPGAEIAGDEAAAPEPEWQHVVPVGTRR